jgi:pimeloyl-ACP methyl ester carboxylesterase
MHVRPARNGSFLMDRLFPLGLTYALLVVISLTTGCRSFNSRGHWTEAVPAPNATTGHHYRAAVSSEQILASPDTDDASSAVAWQRYHASTKGLVIALAQQTSAAIGAPFSLNVDGQPVEFALSIHGFAWNADDVQQLIVVEGYQADSLSRVHRRKGIGVPVVVRRCHRSAASTCERFLLKNSVFAATAVLRSDSGKPTIELYNPHAIAAIDFGDRRVPLAADLSAPLAYYAIHEAANVNPISWFLDPGASTGEEVLYFLEPYQPGKIPIVFVHGLVSSPSTWTDMVNDLRATPGFNEHYQVWAFRYATGSSFLRAAAHLRRSLYEAVETVDPAGADPALRATVLVGHSMGGLVSKLQTIDSGNALWGSVVNRPFEQIRADERTRRELAEALFFEPHPNVRRVVFIAVPHGGSSFAARPVGRIASVLARSEDERSERYEQLMADNPDVFSPAVRRRLPTSIDMLEPSNPLLMTIRSLPVSGGIAMHSVIGTGGVFSAVAPSDGIVPVASAEHRGAMSTTYVKADHEHVHREEASVRAMQTILSRHLIECGNLQPGSPILSEQTNGTIKLLSK